jgi:hypothetical protein
MQPQLWTISGAAAELGRDQRMIGAALAGRAPDGKVGNRDGWLMRTILDALDRRKSIVRSVASNPACDECERLAAEIESRLALINAEHDLSRRRRMIVEHGRLVGELDRALEQNRAYDSFSISVLANGPVEDDH